MTSDDEDFDAEMASTVQRLRMALAEAGYPMVHVYVEASGIWVERVPDAVVGRAFELVNVRA